MIAIDDPLTYRSFVLCCSFTAEVARKHLRKRQRELKGILPPLMFRSNLDYLRQNAKVVDFRFGSDVHQALSVNGYDVHFDPVQEHSGGRISRLGDLVEIITDKEMEITIGGQQCLLTSGRWLIPMFIIVYQDVQTKGACKIQFFYLNNRDVLHHEPYVYERIGNATFTFRNGLSTNEIQPRSGLETDGFIHTKKMRRTNVLRFHMSTTKPFRHVLENLRCEVKDHVDFIECSDIDEFSWLVHGMEDQVLFCVTINNNHDETIAWFDEMRIKNHQYINMQREWETKDITTAEEIRAEATKYIRDRIVGLRSFVDIGILEPFE